MRQHVNAFAYESAPPPRIIRHHHCACLQGHCCKTHPHIDGEDGGLPKHPGVLGIGGLGHLELAILPHHQPGPAAAKLGGACDRRSPRIRAEPGKARLGRAGQRSANSTQHNKRVGDMGCSKMVVVKSRGAWGGCMPPRKQHRDGEVEITGAATVVSGEDQPSIKAESERCCISPPRADLCMKADELFPRHPRRCSGLPA
jgi:hypothetical protein